MKAVVQRVRQASVDVNDRALAQIGPGFLVLLGAEQGDTDSDVIKLSSKLLKLRIMSDNQDKMNRSIMDTKGEILVISQFTLCADTSKGNRPSFIKATPPEEGRRLYELFIEKIRDSGISTKTGEFGAHMMVSLINDGPTTIILDTRKD